MRSLVGFVGVGSWDCRVLTHRILVMCVRELNVARGGNRLVLCSKAGSDVMLNSAANFSRESGASQELNR